RVEEFVLPVRRDGDRFTAAFTPGALTSLAGTLALPRGHYRLVLRLGTDLPVRLDAALLDAALLDVLPSGEAAGKTFTLSADRHDLLLGVTVTSGRGSAAWTRRTDDGKATLRVIDRLF
ncbi:MAG: hypothetical protein ABIQ26_03275, partial [Streptosporangiaceae bacterium]